MQPYIFLKTAPTLKDLRDRIDEAIKLCGENATWNGFDDESIYIYPEDKDQQRYAIEPKP